MAPRMIVVGGPPGSGKSTAFPVHTFGVEAFNVDERCRELHGDYRGIPVEIRARAGAECEVFVRRRIDEGGDFAVETTMRTAIAIEQARIARRNGFHAMLFFLATEDPNINVERVRARAFGGGHAAPEAEIRSTYVASLRMLKEAIAVFDVVECFDTTRHDSAPRWIASLRGLQLTLRDTPTPAWFQFALR